MNVSEAIEVYLRERHGVLRPQTIHKHRMTLLKFADRFGEREVGTVTPVQIVEWRNELTVKPSSANKYIDRLNAFYRHLVRMRYVSANPCDQFDPLDEGPVRRVRLDPQILPRMLEVARHPRDRALIATALELLLRGGELAALRVGDFKGDHLLVHVEKQKGELAEDEMAISSELQGSLASWLADYRREAGIVPPESYLFPNVRTVRNGTQSHYRLDPARPIAHPEEVVKLALVAAGWTIEPGTGVHAIRRTCARILFDHLTEHDGMDRALGHVSSLMHHSSRRTTELYLGITGDRVMRNKLVRSGGATPLSLAIANVDKPRDTRPSTLGVYRPHLHSV